MKITDQMSEKAYDLARAVYQGDIDANTAVEKLTSEAGMNSGSAADYLVNLRRMLTGELYQRTLNFYATSYFLKKIRSDFGEMAFRNALAALEMHLDYYDKHRPGCQKKLRKLLNEYKDSWKMVP